MSICIKRDLIQLLLWDELPYNSDATFKTCRKCNQIKPDEDFYVAYHKKDGNPTRGNVCTECKQDQTVLRKKLRNSAGKPPEECECCGSRESLLIDHCHENSEFRGWICNNCNVGIGHLGDTVDGLEKALAYMKRHYG